MLESLNYKGIKKCEGFVCACALYCAFNTKISLPVVFSSARMEIRMRLTKNFLLAWSLLFITRIMFVNHLKGHYVLLLLLLCLVMRLCRWVFFFSWSLKWILLKGNVGCVHFSLLVFLYVKLNSQKMFRGLKNDGMCQLDFGHVLVFLPSDSCEKRCLARAITLFRCQLVWKIK